MTHSCFSDLLLPHCLLALQAFPVHLPTFVARLLAFKVAVDTSKLPAVGDLMKAFARLVLGGDRSAWDRALVMPHYTAAGMPLLSSLQVRMWGAVRCRGVWGCASCWHWLDVLLYAAIHSKFYYHAPCVCVQAPEPEGAVPRCLKQQCSSLNAL
eukprot:GHUV01052118.1.p1 GENE.GHUV01052118.1~~GHUV01052118.1.p1  ORF type:complete len:164 (-),score=28.01 GHUV01052118.1:372-833(-)